jgi:hypothetical protein
MLQSVGNARRDRRRPRCSLGPRQILAEVFRLDADDSTAQADSRASELAGADQGVSCRWRHLKFVSGLSNSHRHPPFPSSRHEVRPHPGTSSGGRRYSSRGEPRKYGGLSPGVIGRGIAPGLIPPERGKRFQIIVILRDARSVAGRVATVASALNSTACPWIAARLSVHRLGGCGSVRSACEGPEAVPGLRARHQTGD